MSFKGRFEFQLSLCMDYKFQKKGTELIPVVVVIWRCFSVVGHRRL